MKNKRWAKVAMMAAAFALAGAIAVGVYAAVTPLTRTINSSTVKFDPVLKNSITVYDVVYDFTDFESATPLTATGANEDKYELSDITFTELTDYALVKIVVGNSVAFDATYLNVKAEKDISASQYIQLKIYTLDGETWTDKGTDAYFTISAETVIYVQITLSNDAKAFSGVNDKFTISLSITDTDQTPEPVEP